MAAERKRERRESGGNKVGNAELEPEKQSYKKEHIEVVCLLKIGFCFHDI